MPQARIDSTIERHETVRFHSSGVVSLVSALRETIAFVMATSVERQQLVSTAIKVTCQVGGARRPQDTGTSMAETGVRTIIVRAPRAYNIGASRSFSCATPPPVEL